MGVLGHRRLALSIVQAALSVCILASSAAAQDMTTGLLPATAIEPGEPEERLKEFFEGTYDLVRETWEYPRKGKPKTVHCSSPHSMDVGGFVLFVRESCADGSEFLGIHAFDRQERMYINPGFSNGGGYIGGAYARFDDEGDRYVMDPTPTLDPATGEEIQSRYVAEKTERGYVFEFFLIRKDGTEFLTRRHTYTRAD